MSLLRPLLFNLALLSALLTTPLAFADMKTIQAQVLDHTSRQKVDNFGIELTKDGTLFQVQTITQQPFSLNFDYDGVSDYQLTIKKQGYPDHKVNIGNAIKSGNMPAQLTLSLGAEEGAFIFKSKVLDRDNQQPLSGTKVTVVNNLTGETQESSTDYAGSYNINILSGYEYSIRIHNRDYLKRFGHINYCQDKLGQNNKYCFTGYSDLSLDPNGGVSAATVMMDKVEIGKKFRVDNIYYDYNKATLRADGLPNLDKLHSILVDNPQISVELGSHADSRGSDEYNLDLSQRRAQAAVDYILKRGTAPARITAKGYGESQPLNQCVNGVRCNDAQYEVNRRTEFKIIGIDESLIEP